MNAIALTVELSACMKTHELYHTSSSKRSLQDGFSSAWVYRPRWWEPWLSPHRFLHPSDRAFRGTGIPYALGWLWAWTWDFKARGHIETLILWGSGYIGYTDLIFKKQPLTKNALVTQISMPRSWKKQTWREIKVTIFVSVHDTNSWGKSLLIIWQSKWGSCK